MKALVFVFVFVFVLRSVHTNILLISQWRLFHQSAGVCLPRGCRCSQHHRLALTRVRPGEVLFIPVSCNGGSTHAVKAGNSGDDSSRTSTGRKKKKAQRSEEGKQAIYQSHTFTGFDMNSGKLQLIDKGAIENNGTMENNGTQSLRLPLKPK